MKSERKKTRADAPRIRITSLGVADVERVAELAAEIWRHHYPDIITFAQIEYMLAQRYDAAVVSAELARKDLWWDQLLIAGRMIGFSSYFLTGSTREMKLDKLYVHQAHQRKGYGAMLIDRVVTMARSYGCEAIVLTVNKQNRNAIASYTKYGFRTADAVVKDIGGGFVMDDYVMVKDV